MAEKSSTHSKPFEKCIPEDVHQHFHAAHEEIHASFKALFPPEFIEHRRKARKEMLLAWRSVIDSALERMETKDTKSA
jgi:hypothetical protein